LTSPHSANIDSDKVDQQCGGILARLQPVYARGMKFWKRFSGELLPHDTRKPLIRDCRPDTVSDEAAT
jgi:hypothetical protein